jgi:hypothetical protein
MSFLVREGMLGAVLLTGLTICLEDAALVAGFAVLSAVLVGAWWQVKDRTLACTGLVSAFLAFVYLSTGGDDGWTEAVAALMFVIFVGNGLILGRSGRKELLANAKGASVSWGSLAMSSVLIGLTVNGNAAGGTTALIPRLTPILRELTNVRTLGFRVHRVDRCARRHEQPVPL